MEPCVGINPLPIHKMILTKLDETSRFGGLYNLLSQGGLPVSYLSAGQRVPEDLDMATTFPVLPAWSWANVRRRRQLTRGYWPGVGVLMTTSSTFVVKRSRYVEISSIGSSQWLTSCDESSPENGTRSPKLIAVSSGKGGVGKSNVVANLAVAASRQGRNVMVMDADLALGNMDILLGLTPQYTH